MVQVHIYLNQRDSLQEKALFSRSSHTSTLAIGEGKQLVLEEEDGVTECETGNTVQDACGGFTRG